MAVSSTNNRMNWKKWIMKKVAGTVYDTLIDKIRSQNLHQTETVKGDSKHIIDVIKNEEDFILTKSPIQDFNTKSILLVMPGEEAVFIDNGIILGVLGEGRHILDTMNYPFLSDIISFATGKKCIYSSSIYFIRKAVSQPMCWGTSLQLRDPVQLIATRVMCNGIYRIMITDSGKFLRYFIGNGVEKLDQYRFSHMLKDEILQTIKSYLSEYIMKNKKEILGISSKQEFLSECIQQKVENKFEQYGIQIVSLSVVGIDILDNDPNRKEIEKTYAEHRMRQIEKEGR